MRGLQVSSSRTPDEEKWFNALNGLRSIITKVIGKEFPKETIKYVTTRLDKAREVLIEHKRKIMAAPKSMKSGTALMLSTKAMREGLEHPVYHKTIDGRVIELKIGTPIGEAEYHVIVSKYIMKCTCPDARFLTSKADKMFQKIARNYLMRIPSAEPVLYKCTICKHTLALLAVLIGEGFVEVDKELKNTLWLGLYAITLREAPEKLTPEHHRKAISILRSRGWR